MPGPTPSARPGGGFRPQFGQMGGEHLDENAMQQAVAAKQQGQQATSSAQQQTGGNALQALGSKQKQGKKPSLGQQGRKPRAVGTIPEEAKNLVGDVVGEIKKFYDLATLLDIDTSDTPEEQARKKQMLQRWQKLTQEEQEVAKKKYQQEMQKKQQEEKEKEMKKQQEAQQKAQSIALPSSPNKGPKGPGAGMSKKAKAQANLQRQMKTMSTVAGAN